MKNAKVELLQKLKRYTVATCSYQYVDISISGYILHSISYCHVTLEIMTNLRMMVG